MCLFTFFLPCEIIIECERCGAMNARFLVRILCTGRVWCSNTRRSVVIVYLAACIHCQRYERGNGKHRAPCEHKEIIELAGGIEPQRTGTSSICGYVVRRRCFDMRTLICEDIAGKVHNLRCESNVRFVLIASAKFKAAATAQQTVFAREVSVCFFCLFAAAVARHSSC